MTPFDPRVTPVRRDLAALHLKGKVEAARFVEGRRLMVATATAPLRREPRFDAALDTEALRGEEAIVYDVSDEGWAWAQLISDGYVGYLPANDLVPPAETPNQKVAALRTFVYPGPNMKLPPLDAWPLNAAVAIERRDGEFSMTPSGGFVFTDHLVPTETKVADHADVACRFLGAPYLWGGKTSLGLDCSALVQLSLQSAGLVCPRDTDMQEFLLGERLEVDARLQGLARGDLVFWKGHVGVMLDGERLVHANAHHMTVAVEPLAEAARRIAAKGAGEVTSVKRIGR